MGQLARTARGWAVSVGWRTEMEFAASGDARRPATPLWHGTTVPACSAVCVHHDGKRCEIIGARPGNLCEPVVSAMGRALDTVARRGAPW